jgi:hypothetical protein
MNGTATFGGTMWLDRYFAVHNLAALRRWLGPQCAIADFVIALTGVASAR